MVMRLGLGKNNHLTYASLVLNPRYVDTLSYLKLCIYILYLTSLQDFKNTCSYIALKGILKTALAESNPVRDNLPVFSVHVFV